MVSCRSHRAAKCSMSPQTASFCCELQQWGLPSANGGVQGTVLCIPQEQVWYVHLSQTATGGGWVKYVFILVERFLYA